MQCDRQLCIAANKYFQHDFDVFANQQGKVDCMKPILNINQLITFINVVEEPNLAIVAEKLELTQPAVTLHIQKLEDSLGVGLFRRRGRSLELTRCGEIVFQEAKKLISLHEALERRVIDGIDRVKKVIMVGAGPLTTDYIMPHVVASFKQDHPTVEVLVESSETDRIVRGVIDHSYDLGIIGVSVLNNKIQLEEWIEDELVLIVPPNHHFAARSSVRAEELVKEKFIWREGVTGIRRFVEDRFVRLGVNIQDSPATEVASTSSVLSSINAGLGISIISKVATTMAIKARHVIAVPIVDVSLTRHLYITSRRLKRLIPVVGEFLNHVRSYQVNR